MSCLKQLGRYASLNHNIYIAADPTPVDIDHAAHAGHCNAYLANYNDPPTLRWLFRDF